MIDAVRPQYESPLIQTVEDFARIYADAQGELMNLALQRAYINGALKGIEIMQGFITARPVAANDATTPEPAPAPAA